MEEYVPIFVQSSFSLVLTLDPLCCFYRESAVEILQRYRRDRRKLLDFMLAGSLIKKVIMPPGAVTLDDVDLDQVSVDYVINCAKKGDLMFAFFFIHVFL